MRLESEDDLITRALGDRMKGHLQQYAAELKSSLQEQATPLRDYAGNELRTDLDDDCDYTSAVDEDLAAQLFRMFMANSTLEPILEQTNMELRRCGKAGHTLRGKSELLRYSTMHTRRR